MYKTCLYLSHGGIDGVGCADSAEASEREVVVEDEDLLRVVEALHVLTGLRVVGAPEGVNKQLTKSKQTACTRRFYGKLVVNLYEGSSTKDVSREG